MAKFWEHLSEQGQRDAVKLVQEKLLDIAQYREATEMSPTSHGFPAKMPRVHDAGEVICRYIHARLMERAIPTAGLPRPYTHVVHGVSIAVLIREISEGIYDTRSSAILAGNVLNIMRANKVGTLPVGARGARRPDYWLAPWGDSTYVHKPYYSMPRRDAARMEKRIEQEKDKPVKVVVDIHAIPFPDDPTPKQLVEYVRKLVKAFERQAKALETERKLNDELREQLNKVAANGDLSEAATEIRELVEGIL